MSDLGLQNFTPRLMQVLALARKVARDLNHDFVGTEHLLLGLIRLAQGTAVDVLKELDVDLDKVKERTEDKIGIGTHEVTVERIPCTPRAKKVLGLAANEADAFKHKYVGTQHLLLGMIREGEGVAAIVLQSFDPDIKQVRSEIVKIIEEEDSEKAEKGEEVPVTTEGEELPAKHQENRVFILETAKILEIDPVRVPVPLREMLVNLQKSAIELIRGD